MYRKNKKNIQLKNEYFLIRNHLDRWGFNGEVAQKYAKEFLLNSNSSEFAE